ncbi:MAG: 50S ribosomal protein L21, partial [Planctomycetia bacterium]
MYAVVAASGSQLYLTEGQKLQVDLTSFPPGSTIEFDQVLMIGGLADGPKVGQPLLEGAKVVAEVVGTVRG